MTTLDPSTLDWQGVRFMDPLGRVFIHRGDIYRAVYEHRAGYFKSTLKKGVYARCMEEGFLISSEWDKTTEVTGYGPIIKHQRLPFLTAIGEMPRVQALDYARLILKFNLLLASLEDGYGLIDAHAANMGQQGCGRPVWIDLGSIRPLKDVQVGIEEFKRYWWRPLRIAGHNPTLWRMARLAMQAGGISAEEFTAVSGLSDEVKVPESSDMKEQRKSLLSALLETLPASLTSDDTYWKNYHGANILPPDYSQSGIRAQTIHELITKQKPRTVLDLACANGFFGFMAARSGASVLAADYDEGAIERCYLAAQQCQEPLKLATACYDITTPRMRYPQAELVLALAVTHHISLTQGFPFTYIASQLAKYTTGSLITEFMPHGLGATKMQENLPEWYTIDLFADAFRKAFHKVRVINVPIPETNSPRTLVLCESPKL